MWLWVLAGVIALLAWSWWELCGGKFRGFRLPPGPPRLPLLGNLHQLDFARPWVSMRQWGRQYNGLFTMWYGPTPSIVITDLEILKEALLGQAETFAARPPNFLFDHYIGPFGIINTNGATWRDQRRFSLHALRDFGFGKKEMEARIDGEIQTLLENVKSDIGRETEVELDLAAHLLLCVGNIISSLVLGHTFRRGDSRLTQFQEDLDEAFKSFTSPGALLLNSFPIIHRIPVLNTACGFYKMRKEQDALDAFVGAELAQCRKDWAANPGDTSCFAYAYFQEMAKRKATGDESFSEKMLLYTVSDLFIAGMETTVTTLKWAFLFLLHNPHVQEKLHAEMASVIGERSLSLDDRSRLPYLQATLNEIQRLANIVPLNLPHATTKETTLRGYDLPCNVLVQPEMSAVLADENHFPEPDKFDPERFLDSKVEALIPFSLGKRSCLGESLARMELFLVFGTAVATFAVAPADSARLPSLEPVPGLTLAPLPYSLRIRRR